MTFVWLAFFDALLAITMIAAGMVGAHFYLIAPFMGFAMFGLGVFVSLLGLLIGLLAIYLTRTPRLAAGRKRAMMATVVCAVIAVPMVVIVLGGSKYPPINDITTDFDSSPEFVYAQQLQHEANRNMKYDKAKFADRQLAGYGPIGPIKERLSPADAYARVLEVAQTIPTWKITYKDPATNTFEAVATSKMFHFNDDVVVQVRPAPDGTSLIEMRSKSRDGIGDFGVNAKRIRRFYDRVALARSPTDQNPSDQEDMP